MVAGWNILISNDGYGRIVGDLRWNDLRLRDAGLGTTARAGEVTTTADIPPTLDDIRTTAELVIVEGDHVRWDTEHATQIVVASRDEWRPRADGAPAPFDPSGLRGQYVPVATRGALDDAVAALRRRWALPDCPVFDNIAPDQIED